MIPNTTKVASDVEIAREAMRVAMFQEAYERRLADLKSCRYIDEDGKERALTPLEIFENVKVSFDTYMVAADALGCMKRANRQSSRRAA